MLTTTSPTTSPPLKRSTLPEPRDEHTVQRKLVKWLRARGHRVKATANEQVDGPGSLGRLKAQGMEPGWPDLDVWRLRRPQDVILIEVKTVRGRLTANQRRLIPQLRAEGHVVLVVHGINDAQRQCLEVGL